MVLGFRFKGLHTRGRVGFRVWGFRGFVPEVAGLGLNFSVGACCFPG